MFFINKLIAASIYIWKWKLIYPCVCVLCFDEKEIWLGFTVWEGVQQVNTGPAAGTKKQWWNVTVVKQILSSRSLYPTRELWDFLACMLMCGKDELTELCIRFT